MRVSTMLASVALLLAAASVRADPAGDELADSACVALNFPALPPTYVAEAALDLSAPGVAGEGLVFEEHGRQWLRWTRLAPAPAQDPSAAFHALCRVYRQTAIPDDNAVPTTAYLVRVEKVTGPGTHWFAFRRTP